MTQPRDEFNLHRRAFLGQYAGSLGGLALASLLGSANNRYAFGNEPAPVAGAPKKPKAKSVICLFQHGGPSQMDLFDPKPALEKWHGMPYPGELDVHFTKQAGNLLASPFKFKKQGQAGIEISEILPHTAEVIDDLLLVRSMKTFTVDHEAALRLIHNGKAQLGRPTWGSWVIYSLGSENQDLPSYVVLGDPDGLPIDGVRNWTSGWLPALYQGTPFLSGPSPVLNLKSPEGLTPELRARQMQLLAGLNSAYQQKHPENNELSARIANFEIRESTAVPGCDRLCCSDRRYRER